MPASKQGTATEKIWTKEEQAAIKESARERKKRAKLTPEQERDAGEQEIQAKIAEMPEPDHSMAARIHALVLGAVPELVPRTYYGMPAYAMDGKTICFFQPKSKFKVRYATFGFQPDAKVDAGDLFPVAFAVMDLTPAAEKRIVELVKRAVS